jgi:hypothetical protein
MDTLKMQVLLLSKTRMTIALTKLSVEAFLLHGTAAQRERKNTQVIVVICCLYACVS